MMAPAGVYAIPARKNGVSVSQSQDANYGQGDANKTQASGLEAYDNVENVP
jgi:hypothetical protein